MQSVKLNVGGHYFTTSLQTLTKDPNSMLAAMFLETFEMKPSEDGAFFIDRDGTHFRFTLNYLRTGKLTSPEGEAALKELQEEAEFYQIEGLIEKLKVNPESLTSVKLNLGGHHFTTSLQTLTKDPNSKLATMFSGKVNMKLAEDGAFFIDRDGTHFRFILNYLRTGKLTSPEGEAALKELQEEAEFYQIEGLIEKLKVNSESLTSVKLNVGGHHFTTSLQTLTRDPNSMLAAMFSGKFPMEPHGDGAFFIDRDGTHFRFILNYLRTGKLTFPEGATALAEFKEEADFYQIQGILDELDDTRLKSEILTDEEHRSILVSWLPPKGEIGRRRRYRLLFRASRDGFSAATFHSKCDDKGPTITIVQSGDNKFGGFTDSSWGRDSDENCREAFLFSMVNPFGSAPTKMLLRPDPEVNWSGRPGGKSSNLTILVGILPEAQSGPAFGSQEDTFRRYDLLISGNANVRDSSSESLGASYQCPEGYKGTFFTGKRSFMVSNYEVFEVFN